MLNKKRAKKRTVRDLPLKLCLTAENFQLLFYFRRKDQVCFRYSFRRFIKELNIVDSSSHHVVLDEFVETFLSSY